MNFRTVIILPGLLLVLAMPPASRAGISVTSGLTYEKDAGAGAAYQGTLQLKNPGNASQEVKVYQTDYLFYADGRNLYGDPGTTPRSNAGWITFAPRRLVIPPGGTAQVAYAVAVPADDALAGTYWSLLMVEAVPADSPEAVIQKKGKVTFGISQVMRYAAQMVTHISGTGERNLRFAQTRLVKENGRRILQVDLENIGQIWLKPALWVDFYDEAGRSAGKFDGGKSRIYPATSARFTIDLSSVPKGQYKALVVADCGGDALFGATHSFKFKDREAE